MLDRRLVPLFLAALAFLAWASLALGMPDGGDNRPLRQTFSGTLVVQHADLFTSDRALFSYSLRSGPLSEPLSFDGAGPLGLGGRRVKVTGTRTSEGIRVEAGDLKVLGGPRRIATESATYHLAVILINFQNSASTPWTPAQVDGAAFHDSRSMAAYYDEQSFGQTRITGDVLGWYTVPYSSTSCDPDAWARAGRSAAEAGGESLSAYDHFMFVFPATACGWSGLSYLPGNTSWINGTLQLRTLAHEFGHNLGIHHASSLSCAVGGARVPISSWSNCSSSEYGDPFDVMGAGTRHTNDFHKGQLGWLAAQTIAASGLYTIYPQEIFSGGPQLLRIPRGETGWYLYLELRRPFPRFDDFAPTDPAVNGVTVRLARDLPVIAQSYLVDATPKTVGWNDAALPPGTSLSDPVSGVTVTTKGVSADSAVVRLSTGGANLVLGGSASPSPVDVNKKLTYQLTVTNAGPKATSGVLLSFNVPSGVTYVSSSTSRGSCTAGPTVDCTLGSIASGAKATVSVAVRPQARGTLSASATTSTDGSGDAVTITTTVK